MRAACKQSTGTHAGKTAAAFFTHPIDDLFAVRLSGALIFNRPEHGMI